MRNFQTVLLIGFGVAVVLAVMIFSGVIPTGGDDNSKLIAEPVVLWGTIDESEMERILKLATDSGNKSNITYVKKDLVNFENILVDALAGGVGPDLILVSQNVITKQRDKILTLPYTAISERQYKDTFLESAEIFISADGVLAMPLYLDPIVMYWNRDMFTRAGVPNPPTSWTELQLLPPLMTKVDTRGDIGESAVAMGGVNNITNFKEILAAQFLQTGNKIVKVERYLDPNGTAKITRSAVLGTGTGASSALRYYVDFANPNLTKYSWNSAKRGSQDEFIAGRLGVYFGRAGELESIRTRNAHLNFDVALLPQVGSGDRRATYADIYSLAIMRNSKSTQSAFAVAYTLTTGSGAKHFADRLILPPARRDLVTQVPSDPIQDVFYKSAVIAQSWFDPSGTITRRIFADMVESVMIGKSSPSEAISIADSKLVDLLK